MRYDYVSIEKSSIFDYDHSDSVAHTTHDQTRAEKHWTYVSTSNQNNFLPIVCVKLFGSTEIDGRKGMAPTAMYAQRQLHKATIPGRHKDVVRIKLKALHASVKLWDMTIHYRSGVKQLVQVPEIIYQNCESPLIELKEEGPMESVTFSLNAVAFSDKDPVLWIWGR